MRRRLFLVVLASLTVVGMGCRAKVSPERPDTKATVVDRGVNFGRYTPEPMLRVREKADDIEDQKPHTSTDQLGFDN